MEIQGSRILILGGSGLVGMAICREILPLAPARIVVSGLMREEVEAAVRELEQQAGDRGVELVGEWGDVFVSTELKDLRRPEILADPTARARLLDDLFAPAEPDAVERSTLGALLLKHRPEIIVDCINTATIFAYQNVFASAGRLLEAARAGSVPRDLVESHLNTLYLPQLIRHVQIALEAMKRVETQVYLKIGTSGTGGMGLNIPFTHSEERPSRMLLAKASVAGAHTMLLFLMARTPGAPAVKEIKPTAAISWKRVAFGEVRRGGRTVPCVDSVHPVTVADILANDVAPESWSQTGDTLRGVYLDAGENGLFSPAEFETLTSLGLMEFITPEEVAQDVVRELRGEPTGHDVVAALDASSTGPTYRAGVLRQYALQRMDELEREHSVESVAYEMLGPPRLSKLLFEAAILARLAGGDLRAAALLVPEEAAERAGALVMDDAELRSRILTIGLPILLPDGTSVLRGPEIRVGPEEHGSDPERLIEGGWIDLRATNWVRWRGRVAAMLAAANGRVGAEGGSRDDLEPGQLGGAMRPGSLAAWIFRHEERGERIKR